MTSHGSRFTQSMKSGGRSSSSAELNDLKRLKSRYGSHLGTLRELFPDWSDDDLIFAIQDADGDLEVAIDRISEGLVSQWDEVKTKKSKKEAVQKAKAVTTPSTVPPPPLPSTQQQYQKTDRPTQRGGGDRARRGGRGGANSGASLATSRVPKQTNNHTAAWGPATTAPSKSSDSLSGSGSWAAIAKKNTADARGASISSQEVAGTSGWDEPSNPIAPTGSTGGGWDTTESEVEPDNNNGTSAPSSSEQPKTWASLLKSKPKAEPEPQKQTQEQDTAPKSEWDAPAAASTLSGDGWGAPSSTQEKSHETPGWDEPASTALKEQDSSSSAALTDAWTSTEAKITKEENEPFKEVEGKSFEASSIEAEAENTTSAAAEALPEPISTSRKPMATTSRRLKQDVPVVLPDTGASINSIGVKFGSLSLDDGTVNETIQMTETVLHTTKR
ncbi:hypothetical protein BX666DRAFT_1913508 [Dichotomocladium elegans]|nr:hypothetical protein BX666DRAFT_1913508 [Dichotomocladium elegans]